MKYYLHRAVAEKQLGVYKLKGYDITEYNNFEEALSGYMRNFRVQMDTAEVKPITGQMKKVLITTSKQNLTPKVVKFYIDNRKAPDYRIEFKEIKNKYNCCREYREYGQTTYENFILMVTNYKKAIEEYMTTMSRFENDSNKYYIEENKDFQ